MTFGERGEEGDFGDGPGTARLEELLAVEIPLVERRVGDGGGRGVVELLDACGALDDEGVALEAEVVRAIAGL